MCVYVCVLLFVVCIWIRVCVCMYVWESLFLKRDRRSYDVDTACMYVCMYICMYVVFVYCVVLYVFKYACMHFCVLYVFRYVFRYMCIRVYTMHVCKCTYTHVPEAGLQRRLSQPRCGCLRVRCVHNTCMHSCVHTYM
jgi:hypothetical protein